MKRLKSNQLGPWCSFCAPKTSRAVWREHGGGLFACRDCVPQLEQREKDVAITEARVTDADRQTWMNL